MPIYSLVLLLGLLILSACTSNYPQESRLAYAQRVCMESSTEPSVRDEFMRQCVAMEMQRGSSPLGYYAPASSIRTGNSMYNNPDAFGPMGVWGPTWQQFNGAYQQQSIPPMPQRQH